MENVQLPRVLESLWIYFAKDQWFQLLQDHKTKLAQQTEVEIEQGVPEAAQPEEQEEPK